MTICIFKIRNGDDVIACLDGESTDYFTISNPLKLLLLHQSGVPVFAFTSWFPLQSVDCMEIPKIDVVSLVEVDEDLAQIYDEYVVIVENQIQKTKRSFFNMEEYQQEKKIYH